MTILEVMKSTRGRPSVARWTCAALMLVALTGTTVAQQKRLSIDDIYDPLRRVNFSG